LSGINVSALLRCKAFAVHLWKIDLVFALVREERPFGLGFVVALDVEVSGVGCDVLVSGATASIARIPKAIAVVFFTPLPEVLGGE
jgi:hypothetical protein